MILLPASANIAVGVTQPMGASGGSSPYTYSIVSGPGSIDSSTGLFLSPSEGVTVVRATDSLGATADISVNVMGALKLLCEIIERELGLSNGRVYLWNQKIRQPTDSGLMVAVSIGFSKPFASIRKYDPTTDLAEVQSVNVFAKVDLDIISKDLSAFDRKEEVLMALNSSYSQGQQSKNSFHIAKISGAFVNLSQGDGAAIPYRFTTSVNIQYIVSKTKSTPYFDDFTETLLVDE